MDIDHVILFVVQYVIGMILMALLFYYVIYEFIPPGTLSGD